MSWTNKKHRRSIKPELTAVEAWNPSHWTAREFPNSLFLDLIISEIFLLYNISRYAITIEHRHKQGQSLYVLVLNRTLCIHKMCYIGNSRNRSLFLSDSLYTEKWLLRNWRTFSPLFSLRIYSHLLGESNFWRFQIGAGCPFHQHLTHTSFIVLSTNPELPEEGYIFLVCNQLHFHSHSGKEYNNYFCNILFVSELKEGGNFCGP